MTGRDVGVANTTTDRTRDGTCEEERRKETTIACDSRFFQHVARAAALSNFEQDRKTIPDQRFAGNELRTASTRCSRDGSSRKSDTCGRWGVCPTCQRGSSNEVKRAATQEHSTQKWSRRAWIHLMVAYFALHADLSGWNLRVVRSMKPYIVMSTMGWGDCSSHANHSIRIFVVKMMEEQIRFGNCVMFDIRSSSLPSSHFVHNATEIIIESQPCHRSGCSLWVPIVRSNFQRFSMCYEFMRSCQGNGVRRNLQHLSWCCESRLGCGILSTCAQRSARAPEKQGTEDNRCNECNVSIHHVGVYRDNTTKEELNLCHGSFEGRQRPPPSDEMPIEWIDKKKMMKKDQRSRSGDVHKNRREDRRSGADWWRCSWGVTTNLKCLRHCESWWHNSTWPSGGTTNARSCISMWAVHRCTQSQTGHSWQSSLLKIGGTETSAYLDCSTRARTWRAKQSPTVRQLTRCCSSSDASSERERESASGNLFCRERSISVVVHGDDFFAVWATRWAYQASLQIPPWCVAGENENCRIWTTAACTTRCFALWSCRSQTASLWCVFVPSFLRIARQDPASCWGRSSQTQRKNKKLSKPVPRLRTGPKQGHTFWRCT